MEKKKNQFKIEENSSVRFILRSIGICVILYLGINFNDNQEIYGISIFIISFFLLVKDESYKIKSDSKRIEITYSNILKISASKESVRYDEIDCIEFTPAKFSFTLFILNMIIRSGTNSNKESIITIYKKNGEIIELKNIGSQEDINHLQQWL
tara:strand:- start:51843 stop:52301 length:459 start_codon:yes stop_codon:yes gene_type:complete